jgi:hypothetical protein
VLFRHQQGSFAIVLPTFFFLLHIRGELTREKAEQAQKIFFFGQDRTGSTALWL